MHLQARRNGQQPPTYEGRNCDWLTDEGPSMAYVGTQPSQ